MRDHEPTPSEYYEEALEDHDGWGEGMQDLAFN